MDISGSVAPNLTAEFGFSYAEIGTLIGLFMMPGLFLAPAGWLASMYSDRALITSGLIALAAGGALAIASGNEHSGAKLR